MWVRKDLGWFGFIVILVLGLAFMAFSYGAYRDSAWQDRMSERSPVVCMKITERYRGAGTVKYPDEIYARYQNKRYHFEMGRKYFRSLAGVDTIAVYLDAASGRAILPTSSKVRHYAFLYIMIAGLGLAMVVGSVIELWRLLKAR